MAAADRMPKLPSIAALTDEHGAADRLVPDRTFWRYYFAGRALAGLAARGWLEPYPDGWPAGVAGPSAQEVRAKVEQCMLDTAMRAREAAEALLGALGAEATKPDPDGSAIASLGTEERGDG